MRCPTCIGAGTLDTGLGCCSCPTCSGEGDLPPAVLKAIVEADSAGMTLTQHRDLLIYPAIERERAFQDKKYPGPDDLATLIHVMMLEMAEVQHAIVKEGRAAALREILQVVAVGVLAIEQHGLHERRECTEQRIAGAV